MLVECCVQIQKKRIKNIALVFQKESTRVSSTAARDLIPSADPPPSVNTGSVEPYAVANVLVKKKSLRLQTILQVHCANTMYHEMLVKKLIDLLGLTDEYIFLLLFS